MSGNEVGRDVQARRPVFGTLGALALLTACWAFIVFALENMAYAIAGEAASRWVAVPGVLVGFDLSIGLAILTVIGIRLARELAARRSIAAGTPPPLSVLVAAYDEVECIGQTLTALTAQTGVDFEVLIGDDGSGDGTHLAAIERFGCTPAGTDEWSGVVTRVDGGRVPVRVFRLPHAGKGATLNALAKRADHPVLVTLDADTTPSPGALAAMARAFVDPDVVSAAGTVAVRNATENVLTRFQAVEYQRITWVRAAWASLGALEQVPGAFTGVRAEAFAAAGGFPTDSLTEDYELTYRLVDHGAKTGGVPHVAMVLDAEVWTEVPSSLVGFVRQRTRWFAGFLTTLARFRHLIFNPRAGSFGMFRFPIKMMDAVMPLVAFISLVVLIATEVACDPAHLAVSLFAARWGWDALFYATIVTANVLLERRSPAGHGASPLSNWTCVLTESFGYGWLRYATTLRAYTWAARNIQTREPSREPGAPVALRAEDVEPDPVG